MTTRQARDFIRARYGMRFVSYFDRIDPRYGPARAESVNRYLLMYAMGGVYLGLKSTLKHPLDRVLRESDSYLLSHWQDRAIGVHPGIDLGFDEGELQQWHIVCAPEHPFLKAVIAAVMRNIDAYDPARDEVGKNRRVENDRTDRLYTGGGADPERASFSQGGHQGRVRLRV